jgi:hypothetical protein
MTEIMDWGGDMKACLAWIKDHPCPAALASRERVAKFDDEGRTMDRMFDRTQPEQRSYEAYQRLLDAGHRA